MQKASERTLRQTDPYRLALYFGRRQHPAPASTDDLNRIREIADEMLRSGAADQTEWALNLSGLVHDRSGRDHLKESRADQAKAEFNLALRDFELAYRLNPDFSPAHINRGWALLHLGDRQASIEEFRKSIDVHKARGIPPYLDSYIGLGFAYLDLQDAENAIANLKTAKCVEPNYVDPRNEDDAYAGLIKAFQLKTDSKAKDKVIKLRECLKDGRRYDLCRLQTEDDSERSGSASSNGLTMCD